jgi:plastocyanin
LKLLGLAILAVCLAACGSSGGGKTTTKTLSGTVGPGFTIGLTEGGKKVTTVKAGSYVIEIDDKGDIHNFHLTGPGVDEKTSVPAKTAATWKVTLAQGTYSYVCDPHSTLMKGTFTVT